MDNYFDKPEGFKTVLFALHSAIFKNYFMRVQRITSNCLTADMSAVYITTYLGVISVKVRCKAIGSPPFLYD